MGLFITKPQNHTTWVKHCTLTLKSLMLNKAILKSCHFLTHMTFPHLGHILHHIHVHVAGLFLPLNCHLFVLQSSKQILNAQSGSVKVGDKCQNKNKMDKLKFSLKAQKFAHTKQTCYTIRTCWRK